jgi:hypothetical protein
VQRPAIKVTKVFRTSWVDFSCILLPKN